MNRTPGPHARRTRSGSKPTTTVTSSIPHARSARSCSWINGAPANVSVHFGRGGSCTFNRVPAPAARMTPLMPTPSCGLQRRPTGDATQPAEIPVAIGTADGETEKNCNVEHPGDATGQNCLRQRRAGDISQHPEAAEDDGGRPYGRPDRLDQQPPDRYAHS